MFTGIVTDISKAASFEKASEGAILKIDKPKPWKIPTIGNSVSVNGVCLTVTSASDSFIEFFLSHETLSKTTFGKTDNLESCNLEQALRVGDQLGGHFVYGHVDFTSTVLDARNDGDSRILEIQIPALAKNWFIPKGNISVNGVSLTVNQIHQDRLSLCLIPETLSKTNLKLLKAGDHVNIEADQTTKAISETVKYYLGTHGRQIET